MFSDKQGSPSAHKLATSSCSHSSPPDRSSSPTFACHFALRIFPNKNSNRRRHRLQSTTREAKTRTTTHKANNASNASKAQANNASNQLTTSTSRKMSLPTASGRCLLSLLLLATAPSVQAFAAPKRSAAAAASPPLTTSCLRVGYSLEPPPPGDDLLSRARQCASSEMCSVDDARELLRDILTVQSKCGDDAVESAVCEDQDTAAAVVSSLRYKIEHERSEARSLSSPLPSLSMPANVAVGSAVTLLALAAVASTITTLQPDAVPFTLQEWWWAAKGGYLDTMVHHYMQHGGLFVGDVPDTSVAATSPFNAKEWAWALRDGYLSRLMSEAYQYGGLDGAAESSPPLSPLTLQEYVWAARDGYLGRALASAGLDASSSRPLSVEEWSWALRDGYLPLAIRTWYEQGGM